MQLKNINARYFITLKKAEKNFDVEIDRNTTGLLSDSSSKFGERPMNKASKRRGQTSIIMEILNSALHEGVTKTAIIYKIGFNFGRVEKYIDLMLSTNLLEQVESAPFAVYRTTKRGEQAFQMLAEADAFIFGDRPLVEQQTEKEVLA
ncbi:MAG: winged helix-turn-helix domain-containing protein [Nitrososphaerales archaeon]